MKSNKKLLTCKIETTYGTDASPAVGTDDVLVSNFSITPLNVRYAERNHALPYFGSRGKINVGDTMQMEFDLEMAGAGTVDAVPGYGSILRACATAQTITATTGPVDYDMISDAEESATFYFYWDGVLHKMVGAYGSAEWRIVEGQIPYIHIATEGLYSGIAVATVGTPDLSAFQTPLAVTKTNTTFSLHGYEAALASLTITQGNQHVYKNRPNSEKMHFTGRQMVGQVSIEAPKTNVKDFFAICRAGTTGALAMTHGTADGNKVILSAGQVQLTNPRTSEGDNMIMLAMDLTIIPTAAGNDEFTFSTQ